MTLFKMRTSRAGCPLGIRWTVQGPTPTAGTSGKLLWGTVLGLLPQPIDPLTPGAP